MNNKNLLRGVFLVALALLFGGAAMRYPMGSFGRAGPGLFPMLVCALILLIGVASIVRALLTAPVPIDVNLRNIGIVLASLCGFALISEHVNMLVGIVFLVFFATLAGRDYSVLRNVKVCVGLILIAFGFWKGLGLQLPLF